MANRWYLAYGSNLASKTFREQRGIHPLAEANVIVPSLELVFDLPGIPYWEPCFANVRLQKDEEQQDTSDKGDAATNSEPYKQRRLLMGVAYLITPGDFARIIATEGGGSSYKEVDVECWDVSGKMAGENERIMAATLLAPDSRRRSAPMQPSKRYIDIIRTGAREHEMPTEYIAYLDSIPYYRTTSLRQRTGAVLFIAAWSPVLLVTYLSQLLFADPRTGRIPRWVSVLSELVNSAMWGNYFRVWKRIFGSGEMTSGRNNELNTEFEKGQKK